jgi:hypothetical protein
LSLSRRFEAKRIEEACRLALERGAKSSKSIRQWLEDAPSNTEDSNGSRTSVERSIPLAQKHELIRPSTEYGDLWDWMTEKKEKRG